MDTRQCGVSLLAGSVLLTDHAMPQSQRQDVADALLYAQLLANKHAGSRFNDHATWHKAYRASLSGLGWIVLAQFNDAKLASSMTWLASSQPLQAWLGMRDIDADRLLGTALKALRGNELAQRHLCAFTQRPDPDGTQVALELGIARPGPEVNLCSIAFRTRRGSNQSLLDTLIEGDELQGEVQVRGLTLLLDEALHEAKRAELHALMADKQREGNYRLDIGPCLQGEHHG